MTDETVIEPISASADGKRNSYCLSCKTVGAQMNYAACLNRVAAVDSGTYPRDWSACSSPTHGCPARTMRHEEILAGKAIYFAPRATIATAAATAGRWVVGAVKKVASVVTTSAPPAPPAPKKAPSMFDAMANAGSLADAVTAAATRPVPALTPAETKFHTATSTEAFSIDKAAAAYVKPGPLPTAKPGESPLQMALRLKKEREAAQ